MVKIVADVIQYSLKALKAVAFIDRDFADAFNKDCVEVGQVPAQLAPLAGFSQPMDPVFRRGTRHGGQELFHVHTLLIQEAVHELHRVFLAFISSKVGKRLEGLGNEGEVSVTTLTGKLLGEMKEVWPQDGRAEVAKEEATRD